MVELRASNGRSGRLMLAREEVMFGDLYEKRHDFQLSTWMAVRGRKGWGERLFNWSQCSGDSIGASVHAALNLGVT